MSWHSYRAWARDRMAVGSTLSCPLMVAWLDLLTYCDDWGFDTPRADDFVAYLELEEGVTVRDAGRGRLRRVVDGVGLVPARRVA